MRFPRVNMIATGERIHQIRQQQGYSVRELQQLFGFNEPQSIYRWEWGRSIPSIDNLVALSYIFQIPIDSILVLDEPDAVSGIYRKSA